MSSLSAPISVAKVAASLGVVSGDVGTLCTSSKINKASLRKPTWVGLNPVLECNSELELVDKKPTGTYKEVGFGLFVPYCDKFSQILATSTKPWVHVAPTTANDNYKCLAHFEGYDHGAKLTSVFGTVTIAEDAEIRFTPALTSTETSVAFETIPFFKGAGKNNSGCKYYYGCEIYVNNKSPKRLVCANAIGSNTIDTLYSGITAKQGNDVKVVVFVTNEAGKTAITNGNSNGNAYSDMIDTEYYSCAFAEGIVTSKSESLPTYEPQVNAWRNESEYILEFTNPHPTKAIKPFTVVVKFYNSDGNSATMDGFVANVEFRDGVAATKTVRVSYLDPGYPIRLCTHNVFYVNSSTAIEVRWPLLDIGGGDMT